MTLMSGPNNAEIEFSNSSDQSRRRLNYDLNKENDILAHLGLQGKIPTCFID